jgi:hypothetical protein
MREEEARTRSPTTTTNKCGKRGIVSNSYSASGATWLISLYRTVALKSPSTV